MADNIELKNNLMSFKETFREYTDYYTVIGGTACMILMEEASRDFRATKDVDMILIMEDGGKEFCKTFWEYILRGKYTCGWKNSDPHYYRFTEPAPGFPSQIESVLLSLGDTSPYYQIVVDRKNNTDTFEIQVELAEHMLSDTIKTIEDMEAKITEAVHSTLGIQAKIRLVEPKSLPRSEGKAVRVIDRRKLVD